MYFVVCYFVVVVVVVVGKRSRHIWNGVFWYTL